MSLGVIIEFLRSEAAGHNSDSAVARSHGSPTADSYLVRLGGDGRGTIS
jgi:hypothetical protein